MSKAVQQQSVVKRPSRLRGWLRALGFGLQLSLVLAFVSFGVRSYLARTRLQASLAQMDRTDPGWRLQDIEAARAVVPDGENSALVVLDVEKDLPHPSSRWLDPNFDTELQGVPPERRLRAEQHERLVQCLAAVRPAIEKAKTLCSFPRGRFPIVYARNPMNTKLDAEQQARGVFRLLNLDAMSQAESGDMKAALSSCRAALNTSRSIGDEPNAVSQLVRVAGANSTCKMGQRVLAQGEPAEDDLSAFQEALKEEDDFSYWDVARRGDRACINGMLESIESGETQLSEMADAKPGWSDWVLATVIQENVRAVHPQLFTYTAKLRAAGEMPAPVRAQAFRQLEREARTAGFNPVTVFVPAELKLADAFLRTHAVVRCTVAALAAERYRRLHGDWPPSLEALTPDLLPDVPTDPFTDDPLLYRRMTDGAVIYSVSTDGVDNGGAVDEVNPTMPGADLGIRLWDPAKRRQPPLPAAPAR